MAASVQPILEPLSSVKLIVGLLIPRRRRR